MNKTELEYYSDLANWSFDDINYVSENFTNWIYEEEIKKRINSPIGPIQIMQRPEYSPPTVQ